VTQVRIRVTVSMSVCVRACATLRRGGRSQRRRRRLDHLAVPASRGRPSVPSPLPSGRARRSFGSRSDRRAFARLVFGFGARCPVAPEQCVVEEVGSENVFVAVIGGEMSYLAI